MFFSLFFWSPILSFIVLFLLFQLPRGKKSFIFFAALLFLPLVFFLYQLYFIEHDFINHGDSLGWVVSMGFFTCAIICSFISLITRGITLYFHKISPLKKNAITIFGLLIPFVYLYGAVFYSNRPLLGERKFKNLNFKIKNYEFEIAPMPIITLYGGNPYRMHHFNGNASVRQYYEDLSNSSSIPNFDQLTISVHLAKNTGGNFEERAEKYRKLCRRVESKWPKKMCSNNEADFNFYPDTIEIDALKLIDKPTAYIPLAEGVPVIKKHYFKSDSQNLSILGSKFFTAICDERNPGFFTCHIEYNIDDNLFIRYSIDSISVNNFGSFSKRVGNFIRHLKSRPGQEEFIGSIYKEESLTIYNKLQNSNNELSTDEAIALLTPLLEKLNLEPPLTFTNNEANAEELNIENLEKIKEAILESKDYPLILSPNFGEYLMKYRNNVDEFLKIIIKNS